MTPSSHGGRRRAVPFIVLAALAAASAALWFALRPPPRPAPDLRIAVLPFQDPRSGPPDGAPAEPFVTDGFTRELISALAAVDSLRPIAATSTFFLSGPGDDPGRLSAAARRLGAGRVVTGSAWREGDSLAATMALVDPAAGETLWRGSLRRPFGEFLPSIARTASEISAALGVEARGPGWREPSAAGAGDPVAVAYHLRGRDALVRGTTASALTGAGHFQSAIALDPSFADAYAGLAECQTIVGAGSGAGAVRDTAAARAMRAAAEAVGLGPSNAAAHAALGGVLFRLDWKFREAEAEYRKAVALAPGDAGAREALGRVLAILGREDEALSELRTAAELDPLPPGAKAAAAQALYFAGRYDASVEQYRRAIDDGASDPGPFLGLAMSLAASGRYGDAVDAVNGAIAVAGAGGEALAVLGYAYARRGDRGSAIEILDRFRSPGPGEAPQPFNAALVLRGLGSADDALEFLERALDERDARLVFLGVDPAWDGSRGDPRFSALLGRIGLED